MNEDYEATEFKNDVYYDAIIEPDDDEADDDCDYEDMTEPDDDPDTFTMEMMLGEKSIDDFHYMGFEGEEAYMAFLNTDR